MFSFVISSWWCFILLIAISFHGFDGFVEIILVVGCVEHLEHLAEVEVQAFAFGGFRG